MKHFKVLFFFIIFIVFSVSVYAQGTKEHPLIRPFPGSELMPKGDYQNFSEYSFWVTDSKTGKRSKKPVRGKFWKLTYRLYDSQGKWDGSHSILEYRENYKQAALEKDGTILYENQGYLTFTLPRDDGSTTWCEVHIWNKSQQDICVIEEAGFKKSMTFGPAEMKAALDKDGRIQLYGILFDVNKATLKAESVKQMQHVVTLMKDDPELNLEVRGHTDDQGSDDYNLKLSQRRAETVVAYLSLFGIDTSRLEPKGYGESKPVMPNTTEEGRVKNRRVELVKTVAMDT
jgi:outer membrane protein OmpA-like peptidoglycan-associated protein